MVSIAITPEHSSTAQHSTDRAGAALLLLVVAGTHLALVPEHLEEAPYAGYLFLALSVVSVVLAALVVLRDDRLVWIVTLGVAVASVAAYVVSRTIGLPELSDDVGNWTEPLSFPALTAEVLLAAVALSVCARRRSPGR